jgi:hypothetical protein
MYPFLNSCDVNYTNTRYSANAVDIVLFKEGEFPEKLLTNIGFGTELTKYKVTDREVNYKQESSGKIITIYTE